MDSPRPVAWLAPVVYAAVLAAGLYANASGLGDTDLPMFLGGLALLALLEVWEALAHRARPFGWRAGFAAKAAMLVARTGLVVVVAVADGSGVSRAMFVLIPFTAYFAFGPAVSITLGAALLAFASVPRNLSDTLMYGLGITLTIAMAAVAVQERQARERVAELSAAAERHRLARDFHDSLGHHLTAIVVLLEKAEAFRSKDPRAADRAVSDARGSARQALEDVRSSVRALHDEPFHFGVELARLAAEDVRVRVTGDEAGYGRAELQALYRAAQEGITNARRHSGATDISVTVEFGHGGARLVVMDGGCGVGEAAEGFGLRGLRERIELAGGQLSVQGAPGTGTQLKAEIPRT